MSDLLPYTLENLSGAATRVLLAPQDSTPPLPADLAAIFAQSAPYAAVAPWFNVGATAGPTVVGRNLATAGYNIEQSLTVLLEEPTEITYTVAVPFAELSPQTLKLFGGGTAEAVAAAVGKSAAQKMTVGNIFDLNHFRIAMVSRRQKAQGIVQEGVAGPVKRGRFLAFVGYDCALSAENSTMSFAKGTLASLTMTFKLYPDPTQTVEGEEHGYWLDETAGVLALV